MSRTRQVTPADLAAAEAAVGAFGGDNRAGIQGTLHRISALRNRRGCVGPLQPPHDLRTGVCISLRPPQPPRVRGVRRASGPPYGTPAPSDVSMGA